jgi:hypothetical protein
MDNIFSRQLSSSGDYGFACRQPALFGNNLAAFFYNGRPTGAVYGPIHASATHQTRIGSIHDAIHLFPGDVPLDRLEQGFLNF